MTITSDLTRTRVSFDRGRLPVDHFDLESLVGSIEDQLSRRSGPSMTICSVNLDHLYRYRDVSLPGDSGRGSGKWVYVADGWPVARRAAKVSGLEWPRLAGADLLPQILALVHDRNGSVALVGGTHAMHGSFRDALATSFPNVRLAGAWAPDKHELIAAGGQSDIDRQVHELDPDVVVVALPKPFSERWIASHADDTSGRLYLPFGAAADFVAGQVRRAPAFMQRYGMEWLYRLCLEPRRLARRYLVEAPTTASMLNDFEVGVVPEAAIGSAPAGDRDHRADPAGTVDARRRERTPVQVEGSVVIPAYNEAGVIDRCLAALTCPELHVVVAANGCNDDTVARAQAHGVDVVEVGEASKIAALNAGDQAAGDLLPRIYLDADVVLTAEDALRLVRRLKSSPEPTVAAPRASYNSTRSSRLVRQFYDVYTSLPYVTNGMTGSGCYAVNAPARRRWADFPTVVADDLFVQGLFDDQERFIDDSGVFEITPPRTLRSLLRVRTRSYIGRTEVAVKGVAGSTAGNRGGSLRALGALVRGRPSRFGAAVLYLGLNTVAALRARRRGSTGAWLTDESSRAPGTTA